MGTEVIPPPRVLVLRGGALGDAVLTLPVLVALRASARWLAVVGSSSLIAMAPSSGCIDEVRSIDCPRLASFFAPSARLEELDAEWCAFFAGFEVIVSWLSDAQGHFHRHVAQCSGARLVRGPHLLTVAGQPATE
jgi:heptosyltransferase III